MAKANWLELYRGGQDNDQVITVAWKDDTFVSTSLSKDRADLVKALSLYPDVSKIGVAPFGKPVPQSPESDLTLKGKYVVIDPGHSERKPGARGKNGVEEEDLNRLQADVVAGILREKGAKVEIVDPEYDDLIAIGKRACSSDMFLSLHHNAANGKQHYVCVLVHKRLASSISKRFASICARAISEKLELPLFNPRGSNPGVMEAGLSVLNSAETSSPNGPCVLVESYFVDALSDVALAESMTTKAGQAIAEVAEGWMKTAVA